MSAVCNVRGCDSSFLIKQGYCNKHYLRFVRHGDPLGGGTYRGVAQKFLDEHLHFKGDDCLIWPYAKDARGYARIRNNQQNVPAYRVMCEMAHGPHDGQRRHATHICGNGHLGCINPQHLEWGTAFKNQQDRVRHGTSNRGEQCATHKLKKGEVLRIFGRLKTGERAYLLAQEYKVSPVTILDIKNGRSWAWLTGLPNPKARDEFGNLVAANDNHKKERVA